MPPGPSVASIWTWLQLHPTAYRHQMHDNSHQTISKRNTAPPISKSKLTKVILSSQTCQNTTPDVALLNRGKRLSSTNQSAGTSPSHQEAYNKPLDQPHAPESRQQKQEELQPCSQWKRDHEHSRLAK